MKPFKFAEPAAGWLLRLSFSAFILMSNIQQINASSMATLEFYISLSLVVFAILLVVGGFLSNQSLTVLSALVIALVLVYRIVIPWPPVWSINLLMEILTLSVAILFAARGK